MGTWVYSAISSDLKMRLGNDRFKGAPPLKRVNLQGKQTLCTKIGQLLGVVFQNFKASKINSSIKIQE